MARAETTVIGRSSRIRGRITGQSDLEISGHVEGEVEVAGELIIDVHGLVAANVTAHRLVVRGAVKGDLSASESVVLESGAKVVGDVRAPRISISPGALLRGYVQTAQSGAAASRPKAQTAARPAATPAAQPQVQRAPAVAVKAASPQPARVAAAPHVPPPAPSKAKGPPAPMVPVLKKGAKGTLQKKRA